VDAPVIVANDAALGGNSSIKDYGTGTGGTFYGKDPSADPTCPTALFSAGTATPTVIQSGVPYYYQVERVYRLSSLDNPNATAGSGGGSGGGTGGLTTGGSTGGSTGGLTGGSTTGGLTGRGYESPRDSYGYYQGTGLTTGGTTGTTGTTGGTTGTTGTTGGTTGGTSGGTDSQCYFVSDRSAASGTSTPFAVPTAQSPINNVTVTVPQVFKFLVQRPTTSTVVLKYVIQFSSDSSFARTVNTAEFTDNSSGSIVATPVAVAEVLTVFPGVAEVWWRVGIKNGADKNSPAGGYIFSAAQRFKRPTNPPNP